MIADMQEWREKLAWLKRDSLSRALLQDVHLPDQALDDVVNDALLTTPSIRIVNQWIDDATSSHRSFLVVLGPTGIGKTVAAAHAILKRGHGLCVSESDIRFFAFHQDRECARKFEELKIAPFLVIDNLGRPVDTHLRFAFHELIHARHSKRTLMLSTVTGDEFKARYDERTVERILSAGQMVELAGESLREDNW